MRKLILIAAGLAVLATAGLAAAKTLGPRQSDAVAGTFAATTATKVVTRTCTTADNRTITVTQGTYTGAAMGDADVTGPITLTVRTTVDSTAGVGLGTGRLTIDAPGKNTVAVLTAVVDHGKLAGLIAGSARNPGARLLGNISADYSGAGGFTNGKIGNSTGGSAIELGPTKCSRAQGTKEQSSAHGTVSALDDSMITVAGLTCTIPGDMSGKVHAALRVGDRAQIHCTLVSGTNTLVSFSKKK